MPINNALLKAYPQFSVIDTASPPVSPKVVATILMTQNASVTSGTLLIPFSDIIHGSPQVSPYPVGQRPGNSCRFRRAHFAAKAMTQDRPANQPRDFL